jgi:hypothetical protein
MGRQGSAQALALPVRKGRERVSDQAPGSLPTPRQLVQQESGGFRRCALRQRPHQVEHRPSGLAAHLDDHTLQAVEHGRQVFETRFVNGRCEGQQS